MVEAMNVINTDIWLITDRASFDSIVLRGGRIIYISESQDPALAQHPAVLSASVLLPPYESMSAEVDDNFALADSIYIQYLSSPEPNMYIQSILAAVIQNIPIGIYFGQTELEMRFVKTFINLFYNVYGISVGGLGVPSTMMDNFLPIILASLYNSNIIDYKMFMMKHPSHYPVHPSAISKMAFEIKPYVQNGTPEEYATYFESVKNEIHTAGRFLVDPMYKL